MALLEFIVAETVAYGGTMFAFRKADNAIRTRDILNGVEEDARTPWLDDWLEKRSGTAQSRREKFQASFIVNMVRSLSGRRAFRLVVEGIVNRDSGLRETWNDLKLKYGRKEEEWP